MNIETELNSNLSQNIHWRSIFTHLHKLPQGFPRWKCPRIPGEGVSKSHYGPPSPPRFFPPSCLYIIWVKWDLKWILGLTWKFFFFLSFFLKRPQKEVCSHRGVEVGDNGIWLTDCVNTKAVLLFQCQLAGVGVGVRIGNYYPK